MKVPIVVVAGASEIKLFPRDVGLEKDLEVIDVRNDEYRFYDADGVVLDAQIMEDGTIRVQPAEPPVRHEEELAETIREFLIRVGQDQTGLAVDDISKMPLDKLVAAVQSLLSRPVAIRRSWQERIHWFLPFMFRRSPGSSQASGSGRHSDK